LRKVFQNCIDIVLKPIYKKSSTGFLLNINKQLTWTYIRIAMIISDLLEAANYCLTSKSANATYPCHKCLIHNKDLANINLTSDQIIYRIHENMK
ncbi:26219_t:CDS:1, partial [Racocetra persica]